MICKVLGMLSVMSLSVQGNEAILNNPALKNPEAFLQKFEDTTITKYKLEQELEEYTNKLKTLDEEIGEKDLIIKKEQQEKETAQKALVEKDQALAEERRKNAENEQHIAELQQRIATSTQK